MIEFTIMARRPQETTRLIREATSAVINKYKIWGCVSAAWSIHDFMDLSGAVPATLGFNCTTTGEQHVIGSS